MVTHLDLDAVHTLRLGDLDHTLDDAGVAVDGKCGIALLGEESQADATAPGLLRELAGRAGVGAIECKALLEGAGLGGVGRDTGVAAACEAGRGVAGQAGGRHGHRRREEG